MKFLNNFLFPAGSSRLLRFLVAGFLVLSIGASAYIVTFPEKFIERLESTGELAERHSASTDTQPGDESAAADNTTSVGNLKPSSSKTGSTSSGTTNGTSSGSTSTDTSSSGDSGDTPTDEDTLSLTVAFYSDSQSDSDADDVRHQAVINHILATSANPVIHAGDLMEDGTSDSWNRFLNIAGPLLSSRTFYAALGNNDRVFGDSSTPSPYFLNYFNFPNNERWYSVNSGHLHIVVLDSAFGASDPTQLSWLAADLQSAASQSRITVVVFHHPTFVSTINSYLVSYGVDFVVDGHTHSYNKSEGNGIYYFTMDGGLNIGYCLAAIYQHHVKFDCYTNGGSLKDSTTFNER